MALDYSVKYSQKIAERFTKGSITEAAAGHDYDFTGARAVRVYSMNTVAPIDYGRGSTRFGTVNDVQYTTQEMLCSQAKSFTGHLEKLDGSDISIGNQAGKFLRREIDEQLNPMKDKYRLKKWVMGAGTLKQMGSAPTKSTIVGDIMDLKGKMMDNLVTETDLTLFISNTYYVMLKNADAIVDINAGDYNRKAVEKGVIGEFDGMKVIPTPSSWLPTNVYFMIKARACTADPVKLADYQIIEKAVGFSGPVVQGLLYYDSFVVGARNVGIGVCGSSSAVLNAPTITISSHTLGIAAVTGATIVYTLDGTDPRSSTTAISGTAGGAISGVSTTAGTVVRAIVTKDGCVGIEGTATDS